MANIQSQIKRNRQNETRRQRNKAVRKSLKTHMKRFHQAVVEGDAAGAGTAFAAASRKLDKAAEKGVVHRNYAANKKARMAQQLTSLS